jgi:hypothetical protein
MDEPDLVVDPTDPRVMAVGVNEGQTVRPDGFSATNLVTVYFTSDGGESWRRSELPRVGGTSGSDGDPALAFDEDGTLHVATMHTMWDTPLNLAYRGGIRYTSTSDLGLTWSKPSFHVGQWSGYDRAWIGAAPGGVVLIGWMSFNRQSLDVATITSRDGGHTWSDPLHIRDCYDFTRPVLYEGELWSACVRHDASLWARGDFKTKGLDVRLLRLGPAGVEVVESRPAHTDAEFPHILLLPDHAFLFVHGYRQGDRLGVEGAIRERNGSWRAPVDLLKDVVVDDRLGAPTYSAGYGTDGRGAVHLFIRHQDCVTDGVLGMVWNCYKNEIAHAAVDPTDARVLQESILLGADPVPQRAPRTAEQFFGGYDDWYGFAFAHGRSHLAWTEERSIRFATSQADP